MQVRGITISAPGVMAGQSAQTKPVTGINRMQAEGSRAVPECQVTISREGRRLSRQQAEKGAADVRMEKKLLHQQEQMELSKEIRDGYREYLNDIEKQISDYNRSYAGLRQSAGLGKNNAVYDKTLMEKTEEEKEKLKTAMESQKTQQAEENQRLAEEARRMAMQAAGYQDEIDENNRELVTLLKTMEEAEKAEEEREGGEAAEDSSETGGSTAEAGNSVGDVIQNSAAQFMNSSVKREWRVEEMLDGLEASGHWYVDTANSITRNVLQRSGEIKASLEDESFTDEQLAEMMESFQAGMAQNLDNVLNFRAYGLQVLQDTREARIKHIADDPLKGMQETKNSMMQSAADAALGEARQSTLEEASGELAEEVQELIDERNGVDRIPEEKEEEKEEAIEEAKKESEEASAGQQ